jgi:Carboxypeptidase regulatory-like domain
MEALVQGFASQAALRVRCVSRTLVCAALVSASASQGCATGVTPGGGSTLRGRLTLSSGAAPVEACAVELTVAPARSGAVGRGPGSEAQKPRAIVTAPVVAGDGTFRLPSVPPGMHTLRAICPSARALTFVMVGAEAETIIAAPIVLGDATLAATLDPPLDPAGRAWSVTLSTTDAVPTVVAAAVAARNGAWSWPGLAVGSYFVEVTDQKSMAWLSQRIELTRTSRPLVLAIPRTEIAGRVAFGRQPIAATLMFTDPGGTQGIALQSDAGGSFAGTLPRLPAGDWTLVLTSRHPPLERRMESALAQGRPDGLRTWLDLELEPRGASGCVTVAGGAPASGALVTGEAQDGGARVQVIANDDGCFDLGTPPAGTYRVWAESRSGSAEAQEIEIAEGWPQTLHFDLKGSRQLAGRVISDGQPVPGAHVQAWLSAGVPRSAVGADPDGRFEQTVPIDGRELGITVIAPGYATKMTRVFPDDAPIEIALTTAGGELIVDVRRTDTADDRAVLLRREASVEWLDYLAQWGTASAGASGKRVTLPLVESGAYTACLVARSELPALWDGDAPSGRCTSGTLDDGGRLVLSLNAGGSQLAR